MILLCHETRSPSVTRIIYYEDQREDIKIGTRGRTCIYCVMATHYLHSYFLGVKPTLV